MRRQGGFETGRRPSPPPQLRSDDAVHPAEGVLGAAELDVDQLLADLRPEPGAALGGRDRAAVPLELTHRRHDGCRATGEDLGDLSAGDTVAPLVDGELPLLD